MTEQKENNVANQLKAILESNPESLGNIQYGEVVVKVKAGKAVMINVNHAFKLEDMGEPNGNAKDKQG